MAIPTYEYTTMKKIIARATTRLQITDTTAWYPFLKDCAIEAASEMMTALDFNEYTATLPICDFVAVLPENFVNFDRPNPLQFTIDGQVAVGNTVAPFLNGYGVVYTGGAIIMNSPWPGSQQAFYVPTINIQDGKLYFSNNISNDECTISYLGVNIDKNGDLQIPKLNERVIMYFLMCEYKRQVGLPWQTDQLLWAQGKKDRKAKANLPDSFEKEAAIACWNRLV